MIQRNRPGTIFGPAMIALVIALLVGGFVLRLMQNGNIDKLPGIAIVILGALFPIGIALLAVHYSSKRSK